MVGFAKISAARPIGDGRLTGVVAALYRHGMRALGLTALCVLAGCAAYRQAPLPARPDLAASASSLVADPSHLALAALRRAPFDPANGLDPIDVATLAVLNSPDLAAKRAALGVAAAQVFAAGLLPDPQVVLSTDLPDHPGGLVPAYGLTPSLDLLSLINRSSALKAARASATQINLDLLWAEWGVAMQARQLAVSALADESKVVLLRALEAELQDRLRASSAARRRGDLSAAVASADLAALLDVQTQVAAAGRDAAKARGDLNAVIGLDPAARLELEPGEEAAEPDGATILTALESLPVGGLTCWR